MEKQVKMPWINEVIDKNKLHELVSEKHDIMEKLKYHKEQNINTTYTMTLKIRLKYINKALH